MIRTYDGNSFKRVGGKPGDRGPSVGFQRLKVRYTAAGGETSIDLAALNPSFNYTPGRDQITVKRSSGGNLFADVDFYETSATTIGFPAADALMAGEIVDVIREFAITGVMAVTPRQDVYTATATAGQTLVTADFSWPYNQNSTKGVGAVQVKVNGIDQTRGVDYTEVDLGVGSTNQIIITDALLGGENIQIIPTYIVVDQSASTSTFQGQQLAQIQALLGSSMQAFVDQQDLIAVPSTSVVNRAKILNPANDLRASFGVDRVMTQQLVEATTEYGVNGEKVWKVLSDDRDLIRFVGQFWTNYDTNYGVRPNAVGTNAGTDYVEITFYGTGLNILTMFPNTPDVRVSIDGGIESANVMPSANNLLGARGYAANTVLPVASGLTQGVHTAKIRVVSGAEFNIYGFEVVNAVSSIAVNPGTGYINGQKISLLSSATAALKTGFENVTDANVGVRGGRALVYLKANGTVAKAFQAVDATSKTMANTDHTNEEVARIYHVREFGASRSDDFSIANSGAAGRAFTLDDGVTTLIANSAGVGNFGGGVESLGLSGNVGDFFSITFVGTGLDIVNARGTAIQNFFNVIVDGNTVASASGAFGSGYNNIVKIVSGLPYGTHTVKFQIASGSGASLCPSKFIVYQPKKPTLPASTIEIADYCLMADYVANTTASIDTISTGVLRRAPTREFLYIDGTGGAANWGVSPISTANVPMGLYTGTDRQNGYVEYTFYGTGFEWRGSTGSGYTTSMSVTINGLAATTTNFATMQSSAYGASMAFNNTTGVANLASTTTIVRGSGFRVSNLPLAVYKVRLTNNVATLYHDFGCMDIITPIYSPKNQQWPYQTTLAIGNSALGDSRKWTPLKDLAASSKARAKAIGVVNAPTTSSTTYVPLPDMSVAVFTKGGPLSIDFTGIFSINGGTGRNAYVAVQAYVDGIPYQSSYADSAASTARFQLEISDTVPVAPGYHRVDIFWSNNNGSGAVATAEGLTRTLIVKEED